MAVPQKSIKILPTSKSADFTTARISLKGIEKVTLFFTTTGSWSFAVKVSPDSGTTEVTYNKIVPNSTVAAGAFTRVAAVVINNTSDCFTLPLEYDGDAFESMTIAGTRTGGNWTVGYAVVEYAE